MDNRNMWANPDLRLSAGVIATEAQMLPLEMPELLPGNHLAPPAHLNTAYSPNNSWEDCQDAWQWLLRCIDTIGERCGRNAEYHRGFGFLKMVSRLSLPAAGPVEAGQFQRSLYDHWPGYFGFYQFGRNQSEHHYGAVADAVRTTLALLVLAGEIIVDETADTFRRKYPVLDTELPPPRMSDYRAGRRVDYREFEYLVVHNDDALTRHVLMELMSIWKLDRTRQAAMQVDLCVIEQAYAHRSLPEKDGVWVPVEPVRRFIEFCRIRGIGVGRSVSYERQAVLAYIGPRRLS